MIRTITATALVGLTLLVSCVAVPANDLEFQESTQEAVTGERLIARPPESWILVYQLNNPKTRISDFVPPGQTKVEWQTKISFQSHNADDLPVDPITILLSEAEEDQERCDSARDHNIFSGYENNYETSVRLFLCGKNSFSSKGEIKLIKAIRGNQHFYSVRIVRRTDPFDADKFYKDKGIASEEIAAWSNYFKQMSVCDDTPAHPCP